MKTKTIQSVPLAETVDSNSYNGQPIDAFLTITRTEEIPLVFGQHGQTPGAIIDQMIKDGGVSKIALNLDKDTF
jgi:hypothetical protein